MPNIACLGEIRQVWDNQYDLSPPGNAAAQVFSGTVSRMTMSVIIRERDYCNCFSSNKNAQAAWLLTQTRYIGKENTFRYTLSS
jgi:hypothetical protein